VAAQDFLKTIAGPLEKRVVRQDGTAVVHPRDSDGNWASAEGGAEARLALAHTRLAGPQLFLGPLSLGDVLGEGEDVRCVVEFDGFGGKQNGEPLAAAILPVDFSLANRTDIAHIVQCRSA